MSTQKFLLPDVGEGLTEAEIVSWRVAPGDTVEVDDVLVEIETAKSLVELPSPFSGTVGELLVGEGDTVEVGSAIITIAGPSAGSGTEGAGSGTGSAGAGTGGAGAGTGGAGAGTGGAGAGTGSAGSGTGAAPATAAAPATVPEPDAPGGAVLVGYGSAGHVASRRRPVKVEPRPAGAAAGVVAKPPIRKLARDLGVDLASVTPSGASGEITRDDVVTHASQASVFRNIETPAWGEVREETIPVVAGESDAARPAASASPAPAAPTVEGSDGREESIPVRGVRKAVASGMVRTAYSAPHVTVWTDVDASRTMELVKRLKSSPDFADVKVSPLLIMARAVIWAARRTPMVNAAWVDGDDGAQIRVHHYVNLGIAAATPRGLLVPNIKDAQDMSMRELARALQHLTQTAREGRSTPADQKGGTITITNIGVFGMDAGTPILNGGEAGIIALGTITQKPWVVDGEVRPRWVTTVAGSFDHRVVDGDGMSRFVADVASILEEPALLLD